MVFCATVYQPANRVPPTLNSKPTFGGCEFGVEAVALHWVTSPVQTERVLCHCNHVTMQGVLRQLVFNLVVIGCLRNSVISPGPEFAHMLMQNVNDTNDVDEICMTYGKPGFNKPNGWYWRVSTF